MPTRNTVRRSLLTISLTVALICSLGGALAQSSLNAPRNMKLLVVALDGSEADYSAIKFFIETIGIPYDTAFTLRRGASPDIAPQTFPLPALSTGGKGLYQGIILTSGNLGYCYTPQGKSPVCQSSVSQAGWKALDDYARNFGVRTVSYYTFPEARYGLTLQRVLNTDPTPDLIRLSPSSNQVFPYLTRTASVRLQYSYAYLASPAPAPGESTTAVLTVQGLTVAAVHRKADGREYLALTFNNNPHLLHSMVFNYGILNWVTKGVFLGARKVYIGPQVDDHFLPNDLYVHGVAACTPVGFVNDPTYDPASQCPSLRINGGDLQRIADWQKTWNAHPQFARFKVAHAYNGAGAVDDKGALLKDDLVTRTAELRDRFYWVNHTWEHQNLDCFNPIPNAGAGSCVPATYAEAHSATLKNIELANTMGLPLDRMSMVTPVISGLRNQKFLQAAYDLGIRYLVSDTSRPENVPAIPNTGIRNPLVPGILMIPRRPTNLFYNTTTGAAMQPGSLVDEYNYFFGPAGIFRIGGTPDGPPFFATTQTYQDIVERESDALLTYMLRFEVYPQMYHQSNLHRWSGNRSLFTDVHDAAFRKFTALSNLPVVTLPQTDIGREIEARMAVASARVSGMLTPGQGITLTGAGAANVAVTGVCFGASCETYGAQCQSKVPVNGGGPVNIPLAGSGCGTAGSGSAPTSARSAPGAPAPVTAVTNSLSLLVTLRAQASSAADIKRLTDIIAAVSAALDPSAWLDSEQLKAAGGNVFDEMRKAAAGLNTLIKDNTSAVPKERLTLAMLNLSTAAESVASLTLQVAEWRVGRTALVSSGYIDLAAASAERSAGRHDASIVKSKSAWEKAIKALNGQG
jgi:hypothetical protein